MIEDFAEVSPVCAENVAKVTAQKAQKTLQVLKTELTDRGDCR
jgi:hypothetical protein